MHEDKDGLRTAKITPVESNWNGHYDHAVVAWGREQQKRRPLRTLSETAIAPASRRALLNDKISRVDELGHPHTPGPIAILEPNIHHIGYLALTST